MPQLCGLIVLNKVLNNVLDKVLNIQQESKVCSATGSLSLLKEFYDRAMPVPHEDEWRIGLLSKYVDVRSSLMTESTEYIDSLIENLCTTYQILWVEYGE